MKNIMTVLLTLLLVAFLVYVFYTQHISARDNGNQVIIMPTSQLGRITATPLTLVKRIFSSPTWTADLSQTKNCTYTYFYWKDHPEIWPDEVEIAGKSITKDQAKVLMQAPSKDFVVELQRVLYVAILNINAGANQRQIEKTFQNVSEWLTANPPGTQLPLNKQPIVLFFIQTLEKYNNGLVGPKLCLDQPKTPTPTETAPIQVLRTLIAPKTPTATLRLATSTPKLPPSSTMIPPIEPPSIPQPSTNTCTPTRTSSPIPKPPTTTIPPIIPPSHTPLPPAYTPTPKPPTDTPAPKPPSSTPKRTPAPPSNTPTPTPEPPTSTPIPIIPSSTPTPEPTSTKTPKPKPTHRTPLPVGLP